MKYDAIVIGSGQAGVPLALRLADIGWQVALIEKSYLGGTCINNGCTPTKNYGASRAGGPLCAKTRRAGVFGQAA